MLTYSCFLLRCEGTVIEMTNAVIGEWNNAKTLLLYEGVPTTCRVLPAGEVHDLPPLHPTDVCDLNFPVQANSRANSSDVCRQNKT